jgi:hypothetical protein
MMSSAYSKNWCRGALSLGNRINDIDSQIPSCAYLRSLIHLLLSLSEGFQLDDTIPTQCKGAADIIIRFMNNSSFLSDERWKPTMGNQLHYIIRDPMIELQPYENMMIGQED